MKIGFRDCPVRLTSDIEMELEKDTARVLDWFLMRSGFDSFGCARYPLAECA